MFTVTYYSNNNHRRQPTNGLSNQIYKYRWFITRNILNTKLIFLKGIKHSILDVAAALAPPLIVRPSTFSLVQLLQKKCLCVSQQYTCFFGIIRFAHTRAFTYQGVRNVSNNVPNNFQNLFIRNILRITQALLSHRP